GVVIRIPIGRVKSYLEENWGAPFIVVFMMLLMVAALFLASGLEGLANEVAVYAYYSLVIGVVLQFICYLKYGSEQGLQRHLRIRAHRNTLPDTEAREGC
ncbi:MAG: hypothetical protein ACUVUS_10490, partial [Thermoproteota archaeon]